MGMSTVRGAPQWTSWYIFDVDGCWVMVVIYTSSTALIRKITDVQCSLIIGHPLSIFASAPAIVVSTR